MPSRACSPMPFGVGGYCFTSYLCFCKFLLTRCSTFVYSIFTTHGKGEHARHTSRKVAGMPREKEAGLGGMKAVAIRWAEQEAARKARKRPVRLVMWRQAARGRRAEQRRGKATGRQHGFRDKPATKLETTIFVSHRQRMTLAGRMRKHPWPDMPFLLFLAAGLGRGDSRCSSTAPVIAALKR